MQRLRPATCLHTRVHVRTRIDQSMHRTQVAADDGAVQRRHASESLGGGGWAEALEVRTRLDHQVNEGGRVRAGDHCTDERRDARTARLVDVRSPLEQCRRRGGASLQSTEEEWSRAAKLRARRVRVARSLPECER